MESEQGTPAEEDEEDAVSGIDDNDQLEEGAAWLLNEDVVISEKQFAEVHAAEEEINAVVEESMDIPTQLNKVIAVAEEQKKKGIVKSYEASDDSLTVRFTAGITYMYFCDYGEFDVLGDGNGVIGDFLVVTSPSINWNDNLNSNGVIKPVSGTGELTMQGYSAEEVTVDYLKESFKGKELVYWNGHGGLSPSLGPTLLIGEKIQKNGQEFRADLNQECLIESSTGYYALTSRFIDKYYQSGDFDHALFYFSSCHTGEKRTLVDALLNKGAQTVLAYDFTVVQSYGNNMATTFFEKLTEKDKAGSYRNDAFAAVEAARNEHGNSDLNWTNALATWFGKGELKGAFLTLFGDPHYTLESLRQKDFSSVVTAVIDVSGSMDDKTDKGETKLDAAREAARVFISMVKSWSASYSEAAYGIGIVQFASDAEAVASPSVHYDSVSEYIGYLGNGGGTNIASGINAALNQLNSINATDKVIVLMTDGIDSNHNGIMAAAQEAKDAGITIYTIGFGSDVEAGVLTDVALLTGGEYRPAGTEDMTGIIGTFMYSQQASVAEVLHDEQGTVAQGQTTAKKQFSVPDKSGDLNAHLYWPGSELDIILTDPNGEVVAEGYPGASIDDSVIPSRTTVEDALPGTWSMEVFGVEVSQPEEPYYAIASFKEIDRADPLRTPQLGLMQKAWAISLPVGLFLLVISVTLLFMNNLRKKPQKASAGTGPDGDEPQGRPPTKGTRRKEGRKKVSESGDAPQKEASS
ncbi:MAG: VWA domain-containing protein [Coriobacteriaceae bacterium]|nr:VWA domain-containing protein [Coriobacteriaceae bacterium]